MRTILVPLFGLALLGAGGETGAPDVKSAPEPGTTAASDPILDPGSEECRDRIRRARQATGQLPLFQREPASPENPLAIYAVDRTQDGCSVVVMMGDPDDIRPMPEVEQQPVFRGVPAQRGE